jgi:hypothetical protein
LSPEKKLRPALLEREAVKMNDPEIEEKELPHL